MDSGRGGAGFLYGLRGGVSARMQIISRYVFRQAASVLLLILLSLGGIVWIALALRELNVVTSGGQNAFALLKMTTLALPNLLGVIAPFALLIAQEPAYFSSSPVGRS